MRQRRLYLAALGYMVLLAACRTGSGNETAESIPGGSAQKPAALLSETERTPTGFAAEDSYVLEEVTFVWEKVGFGGDCIVTLEPFNMFRMSEGPLSSTVYRGYFDVDGDTVTLRDSASSDGYKNFRFRINDGKTELTFIADGSDNLPFVSLEDGDRFSTELHHDAGEYREAESGTDAGGETDVVPAVMVDGELYFSTGEESTVSGRCGNMDGTITSTVDGTEYPTEDNQSNFGAGAGYQYGPAEHTIEVYMAEGSSEKRWIVFKKRTHSEMAPEELEGVTMEVTHVTDSLVTVVFENDTDKEIETGDYFWLERRTGNGWEALDPVIDNYGFSEIAYFVEKDRPLKLEVRYDWLFGKLEPGEYRIVKQVDDFRGTGDFDTYKYRAEFTVDSDICRIDYGASALYASNDMNQAIAVILDEFSGWEEKGCVLHNIRYTSDDCNSKENLERMNELAQDGTVYTQCIEFVSDYHSPENEADAGAWNPDFEYEDWQWWLARENGGPWVLVTMGY